MASHETDDSPTRSNAGAAAPSGGDGLMRPGTLIKDTWRIVEFAGEGGAGAVYIAEHRSLGHLVAVKTLFSKFLRDREMRRRFLEEAIIQANLNHPNIARVTDVIDDGGLCAIIMEYIDGSSLDRALERLQRPMSIGTACRLMLALLDAMNYAHAQGVVHRDIKPANILIARGTDSTDPKITDFGIAKVLSDHRRTETGTAMGTVYYASPEQLTDAKSVDHRADIYSLGCTFYELLTGELPFEDSSMYGVMRKHVQAPRPDPRDRRPELSAELASVVVRAMAIDRERRPQTCGEFADELRAAMPGGMATSGGIDLPRATSATVARVSGAATGVGPRPTPSAPDGIRRSPVPGPARTVEPPLRFTKPGASRPPATQARSRNPVAIGMWVMIGLMAVALAGFVAVQLRSDPVEPAVPIAVAPAGSGSGSGVVAVAAPAVDADEAPPAQEPAAEADAGPALDLETCRNLVGRFLDAPPASDTRTDEAIRQLTLAEDECPDLFIDAAGSSAFDQITAGLDVDIIRIDRHLLRAGRAARTGDACPDALIATTAAERSLRSIQSAGRDVSLHRFEADSIARRAPRFVELYRLTRQRHPSCPYAAMPPELVALGGGRAPGERPGSGSGVKPGL